MAKCGADYWAKIKTSTGATPEEPYTGLDGVFEIPGPEDWWSWHTLAEQLHQEANEQFKRLGEVEAKAGAAGNADAKKWTEWNRNIEAQHILHERFKEMGSFWTNAPGAGIPNAIKVCEAAVCLMEGVDKSLAVYGASSMSKPGPTKGKWYEGLGTLAVLALVGYGIYRFDKASPDE